MPKRCIFCDGIGPFSLEHAFPLWMRQIFPKDGRFEVQRGTDAEQRSWKSGSHFGFTSRAVCRSCNNGWMSALENSVKPMLWPMFFPGRRTELRKEEKTLLATWAVKTAMVLEFAGPRRRLFEDTHRRHVCNTQTPPPTVHVFIALHLGEFVTRHISHELIVPVPGEPPMRGQVVTLTVGLVAFQILRLRSVGHKFARLITKGQWDEATSELWPRDLDELVIWPPAVMLDDNALMLFAERFSAGGTLPAAGTRT